MKRLCVKTYEGWKRIVCNESGAQAIEWIALAGIIVLIFAALSHFFGGSNGGALGGTMLRKLADFVNQIGNGK